MRSLKFTCIGFNEKIIDPTNKQEIGEIDGLWKYNDIAFIIEATTQKENVNKKFSSFLMRRENEQDLNAIRQQFSISSHTKFFRVCCNFSHFFHSNKATIRHLNRTNSQKERYSV